MSNLENKEQKFAKLLSELTRKARRAGGVTTEDEIQDVFSELELNDSQLDLIRD